MVPHAESRRVHSEARCETTILSNQLPAGCSYVGSISRFVPENAPKRGNWTPGFGESRPNEELLIISRLVGCVVPVSENQSDYVDPEEVCKCDHLGHVEATH